MGGAVDAGILEKKKKTYLNKIRLNSEEISNMVE